MSSTFALAQAGVGSGAEVPESGTTVNPQGGVIGNGSTEHRTTGMNRGTVNPGPKYSTVPSGDPNGPASLSGSGPSTFGGNSPGVIK
jgi:hypothetical protein